MKFNIKADVIVTGALMLVGVAQTLLNNKKDADARTTMKNELKEEILKDLLKEKE